MSLTMDTEHGQRFAELLEADLTLAQAVAANPAFTELVVELLAKAATLEGIIAGSMETADPLQVN